MATDIRFIQKYNEVLQENFSAVLKQNLLFQTQIAVLEEDVKVHKDYETIKSDVSRLIEENNSLRNELNHKNTIIQNSSNTDSERHRLQTALNKQSKELSGAIEKSTKLEEDLSKQVEYIKQLEEMLPNSKKKKLGIDVIEHKVTTVDGSEEVQVLSNDVVKVESAGGNF
jgi:predicted RNase H-like nuclease (RuvC/YqgF family)